MDNNAIKFRSADPWLLQAIILAAMEQEATLKDVVAMGDALNHAMFTFAELEGGLARLMAAGYIEESDKRFKPTNKTLEIYERIQKSPKSLQEHRDRLREAMGAEVWSPGYDPGWRDPVYRYTGISKKDLKEAEKAYHKEFWKKYRELSKRS